MARRFILRYTGSGRTPAEDVDRIRSSSDINVLDSSPRMLLVEAQEIPLRSLVQSIPEWVVSEEQMIVRRDPRPKLRQFSDKK